MDSMIFFSFLFALRMGDMVIWNKRLCSVNVVSARTSYEGVLMDENIYIIIPNSERMAVTLCFVVQEHLLTWLHLC